ncbi:MAG: DUF2608 domain-containing protein [Candidatus Melainabacteria bacterium]|nr:DUF2608 domain-containing protein [Candidatus Melainabacteria bacterium]
MRILLSLLTLLFLPCQAQITQVETMKEAVDSFKSADAQTLAVFDIDNVILMPAEPAFQMANMKRCSHICKKIIKGVPENKRDVFMILTTIDSEPVLIDPQLKTLLESLNKNKVAKMALTGNFTGKFRDIENMEQWKINSLKKLGIDFSQGEPHSDAIVFDELPSYRGNSCVYTGGILFVNGSICTKGEALVAFLKRTGQSPKKVIFIDDREEHVKSVEAALQAYNASIEYTGVHFTGAKDFPSKMISEGEFEAKWKEAALQAQDLN